MSRSVDLFIDSQLPLPDVAHAVAVLTGASSTPDGSGGFRLQRGAVVALVRPHTYVDDGALRLSRYPYVLSARFAAEAPPGSSPEVAFVRHAAELVRERMDSGALLVLDLEQRDRAGAPEPFAVEGDGGPEDPEYPDGRDAGEARSRAGGEVGAGGVGAGGVGAGGVGAGGGVAR